MRPQAAWLLCGAAATVACANFPDRPPTTSVVVENAYPATPSELLVYDAHWLNVTFRGQPIPPGASSDTEDTIPASADNLAYAVLASGWDPASGAPPTNFVVLQSRSGFGVALGETLRIPVDDDHFDGNCESGNPLSQEQADFLTQIVFAGDFFGLSYQAHICKTTQLGDAGAS